MAVHRIDQLSLKQQSAQPAKAMPSGSLARFASLQQQQQLNAAMQKANHHTSADTFGQGRHATPIQLANSLSSQANPATFGMNLLSPRQLLFGALLLLMPSLFQSCHPDPVVPIDPGIENPTNPSALNNFINTNLSSWSINDTGELDPIGNSICTVSVPLRNGIRPTANMDIGIKLNLYDGSLRRERLSDPIDVTDAYVDAETGHLVFTVPGPLPRGSKIEIGAGGLSTEQGTSNEDTVLTVNSGELGNVSPVKAALFYRGFDFSDLGKSRMTYAVYNQGQDVVALANSERFNVDYSQYTTQAQKVAATRAAIASYLEGQGYSMVEVDEHQVEHPSKWSKYADLIENVEFQQLASGDLQLAARYFDFLDGTEEGEVKFQEWTQFNQDGPLTSASPNFIADGPVAIKPDNTGQHTYNVAMGRDASGAVMYLYYGQGSNLKNFPLGALKWTMYHEDIHRRHSSGLPSASVAEEEFAGFASMAAWFNNPVTSQHSTDFGINEGVALFLASSGANGELSTSPNARVPHTNGSRPWKDGKVSDNLLNWRARHQSKFQQLVNNGEIETEGGSITPSAARLMSRLTNGQFTPQVGAEYTYELLNEFYRAYSANIPDSVLEGAFDYLGMKPNVEMD